MHRIAYPTHYRPRQSAPDAARMRRTLKPYTYSTRAKRAHRCAQAAIIKPINSLCFILMSSAQGQNAAHCPPLTDAALQATGRATAHDLRAYAAIFHAPRTAHREPHRAATDRRKAPPRITRSGATKKPRSRSPGACALCCCQTVNCSPCLSKCRRMYSARKSASVVALPSAWIASRISSSIRATAAA